MSGYQIVTLPLAIVAGARQEVAVACPAGKNAVGGGARGQATSSPVVLTGTYPQNGTVWASRVQNNSVNVETFTFYVVCVAVAPAQ